jgi:hypothetical protein
MTSTTAARPPGGGSRGCRGNRSSDAAIGDVSTANDVIAVRVGAPLKLAVLRARKVPR